MDPAILTATTARVATLSPSILPYISQPHNLSYGYFHIILISHLYIIMCFFVMLWCVGVGCPRLCCHGDGRAGVALVWGGGVLLGAAAAPTQNKDPSVSPSTIRTHYTTLPHHILRNTATQYDQYKHLIKVYLIIFMSNTHIVHTGSISQLLTIATSVNREKTNLLQHNVHRPPLT